MYTRNFPPHTPLPENYGGVALREIEEVIENEAPPIEEEKTTERVNEEEETGTERAEETKKEEKAPLPDTGDLLLLALAALLL